MDYRIWFAAVGIASTLVIWGLHRAGRRRANAHLIAHGELAEAQVLKCEVHTGRYASTEVTYTYLPKGARKPLTVTRRLDGGVRMNVGDRLPVRYLPSHPFVSILVGHEHRHDGS
ncbi:MAG TPA: DUF3592 domain-containing protein [Ramlibacter sp.]|uniref:DUF3592 domain-containing protein n=1 Tax=Ramlibacter sp. TaxID=1917967 RepID=UPI002ED5CE2A